MHDNFDKKWNTPIDQLESKSIKEDQKAFVSTCASGQEQRKDWSCKVAINDGFKASSAAYSCVSKYMECFSSVPWLAEVKKGDEWEPAPDSELQKLIDNPNSCPLFSWNFMMGLGVSHNLLCGNSLLLKVGNSNNEVKEIWPLMPDNITVVTDRKEWIKHYLYQVEGEATKYTYELQDVIHLMQPNPGNPLWGIGNLQAGSQEVDTDIAAATWARRSLSNSMIPSGVISFNREFTDMTAYKQIVDSIKDQYSDAVGARSPLIIGNDAKFLPMSMTAAQMDYIESRKITIDMICSIFDVDPAVIKLSQNSTYENQQTALDSFWINTIIPKLEAFRDGINRALPEFPGFRLNFDVSKVAAVQRAMRGRAGDIDKYFKTGMPMEKISEYLGLKIPEYEGWDIGYIASNMIPVGSSLTQDEEKEYEKTKEEFKKL